MICDALRRRLLVLTAALVVSQAQVFSDPVREIADPPGDGGGCYGGEQTILVPLIMYPDGSPRPYFQFPSTPEDRSYTTSFTVRLLRRPAFGTTVTLRVESRDPSEGTPLNGHLQPVASRDLVFTYYTWNVEQTVWIGGVDDAIRDHDVDYGFDLKNLNSPVPSCPQIAVVPAISRDNEREWLAASPSTGLSTTEGSVVTSTVSIACNYSPPCAFPADLRVDAQSSDPTEGLIRGPADPSFIQYTSMTFAPGASSLQVQIRGSADDLDGAMPYSVWLRSFSSNPDFNDMLAGIDLTNAGKTDRANCANNLVAQFTNLPTEGGRLATSHFGFPVGEYFPPPLWNNLHIPNTNHVQGIARTRTGPHLLLTGSGQNASDLFILNFPSKADLPNRWSSNLGQAFGSVALHEVIDWTAEHAGGPSIFGDFAAIPLESGPVRSLVVFYDLSTPTAPIRLATTVVRDGKVHAGAVAVDKLSDGRYLMVVQSNHDDDYPDDPEFNIYVSAGPDIRDPAVFTGTYTVQAADRNFQSISIVKDCASGDRFLIGLFNSEPTGIGTDYAFLYWIHVPTSGAPWLEGIGYQLFECIYNNSEWCTFNAAGGVYVTPSRELLLYSGHYFRDIDDDATYKVVEF